MAVRLILAGTASDPDAVGQTAAAFQRWLAAEVGVAADAATDLQLLDSMSSDRARLEVGFANEDLARRVAEQLDGRARIGLGSTDLVLEEIHAVEVDLDRRAEEPDPAERWEVRFLTPTRVSDGPFPDPRALVQGLLAVVSGSAPGLAVRFLGVDLGDVLSVDSFDLQATPVDARCGWIGRVRYHRTASAADLPVSVLLSAGEVLGLGVGREYGGGVLHVGPVRHRRSPT